jgi:membrane-anchored glycerophosphoryl diester phosphodiesterase (GDPDase)
MKDLPVVAKAVINIILYIVYVLLASVVFSFLFPLVMQLLGQDVMSPNNPIFAKIQIFIAILVLLVSLILRKYFYISAASEDKIIEIKESYTAKKKPVNKKKATKSVKKVEEEENDDEEIKIYVEKEIK